MADDFLITNSFLTTMKSCARKGYWSYIAYGNGIKKQRRNDALTVGDAVHEAIDQFVKAKMRGVTDQAELQRITMDAAIDRFNGTYAPDVDESWFVDRELIRAMTWAYVHRWWRADFDVEWVQSESLLESYIVNPDTKRTIRGYKAGGKLDKLFRRDGKLVLRDHKTTSEQIHPGSNYWRRLLIDSQISHYVLTLSRMGIVVDEVEYDVIRKPQIRPRKLSEKDTAELLESQSYQGYPVKARNDGTQVWVDGEKCQTNRTKHKFTIQENFRMFFLRCCRSMLTNDGQSRYFVRDIVPRTAGAIHEYAQDLYDSTKIVHEMRKTKRFPMNTKQCAQFGMCPFFGICTAGFGVDTPFEELHSVFDQFHKKETPHEELQEVEE